MFDWRDVLRTLTSAAIIVAALGWISTTVIEHWLSLGVENHKHILEQDTERYKHELDQETETYKHKLDQETERYKDRMLC